MSTATSIYTTPAQTSDQPRRQTLLVRLLALFSSLYGLALLLYLLLRLIFGDSLWWLAFLHNFAPYYFVPLLGLVPLLLLMGARRTAVRLLPLLLVGLLMFGPRWLPRPAAAADAPTLRVVTFNVLVLTHQFDRMAGWLRETQADLILLQETGGMESAEISSALGDVYPHTVDIEGTTLVALSRYAVTDSQLVDLGGWFIDRFVLDVAGEPLAVYNVHLAMPVLDPDDERFSLDLNNGMANLFLRYDETYRNSLIRSLLARLAQEDLPYIVAGDFNTSDNSLMYAEMAAVMGDSFRETSPGLGATWPASLGDDELPAGIPPLLRIDYIWHSDALQALSAVTGPDLGSDHLPVMATLALPRPG